VYDWEPRFGLLFPHPTPEVRKRLDRRLKHLKRWLLRELDDHKRGGRTETLRDAARRADRRLKGLRNGSDV
jgi:AAA+ ATPase superfamily predicted ATPase